MSPIAISADRRFHRAHVKPGRRRARMRSALWPVAKYGAAAAIAAVALYRGAQMIAEAHVLRIDRIVVRGNGRMTSEDVLSTLGGLRGEHILRTNLGRWRAQLLTSPWIRDAALRRWLPSTVEVVVSEREPIGIGRVNGELYLVDGRGGIIDPYGPQYSDIDLPIIDGLVVNGATDETRGELAARVIQALKAKPAIAKRLSQVDVSDTRNVSVIVSDDPARIYLGDDRFLARLESYLDLSAAIGQRVVDIDYVDLRFDDRIYVGPVGRSGRTLMLSGGSDGARVDGQYAKRR